MAAVIYLRIELKEMYEINLMASKTRVVPLKTLTIPELELGAACPLSKIMNVNTKVSRSFINLIDVFCFFIIVRC